MPNAANKYWFSENVMCDDDNKSVEILVGNRPMLTGRVYSQQKTQFTENGASKAFLEVVKYDFCPGVVEKLYYARYN